MNALQGDTERHPMLTPSEVLEHIYCPRFTWFMNVQHISQNEDKRFKVLKGREVHQRRETENKAYLRRKIGVVKRETAVYLASPMLRMRGIVDEVLWLKDGTLAPLDYKYTEARDAVFKTHRIQLLMYAMLIQEIYHVKVDKGFAAYIRGGNHLLEIPVDEKGIIEVKRIIDEIFAMIANGRLPKRTPYRARCHDCCYKNICV
jgi:CRISPR-associated exonuclease Cas4